ncbi:MAG: hypothetical protein K2K45_05205 [Muribaculaceae bacterium]|nr:hypothetical protein [Muribaculaceae bacterium]
MDARFLGLDNLAVTLGLGSHKTFQTYYESALKDRETIGLDIEGFEWADPQIDFDYEFLEGEGYLSATATYVDLYSDPLPRGRKTKLKKYTGGIPRQKWVENYGEEDYRKELIEANKAATLGALRGEIPENSIKEYLWNRLFDRMKQFPDRHSASLTEQVGNMKFKRQLTLTAENNPGGITDVTYKSHIPDDNITKQSWYTVDSTGKVTYVTTVDPIEILMEKIYDLKTDKYRGYTNVCLEMSNTTYLRLMKHPKVLQRIGFAGEKSLVLSNQKDQNAAEKVGWEKILTNGIDYAKEFIRVAVGADVMIVHTNIIGKEVWNATEKNYDVVPTSPYADDVILVRPSGIIGKIYNVAPVRPDRSAIFGDIFGGKGIIEYIYDKDNRTQKWKSELTCLAVPTMPKKMIYYEIGNQASEEDEGDKGGDEGE